MCKENISSWGLMHFCPWRDLLWLCISWSPCSLTCVSGWPASKNIITNCKAKRAWKPTVMWAIVKLFKQLFHSSTLEGATQEMWASLVAQRVKRLPEMQEIWVRSLGQEDPWRRKWQPIPVFLPSESHGQRSLVACSLWDRKESDMTERLHFHFHTGNICLLSFKRKSSIYIFFWKALVNQAVRIWATEKSLTGSFQWRGQNKGRHMCGNKRRPDASTGARNCTRKSPSSNPTWPWGWTFSLTS